MGLKLLLLMVTKWPSRVHQPNKRGLLATPCATDGTRHTQTYALFSRLFLSTTLREGEAKLRARAHAHTQNAVSPLIARLGWLLLLLQVSV